jgi:hypothetical protein
MLQQEFRLNWMLWHAQLVNVESQHEEAGYLIRKGRRQSGVHALESVESSSEVAFGMSERSQCHTYAIFADDLLSFSQPNGEGDSISDRGFHGHGQNDGFRSDQDARKEEATFEEAKPARWSLFYG